jgi:hypothetical protein
MSTIRGTTELRPVTARRQVYSPLETYWNAFQEWRKRRRLMANLCDRTSFPHFCSVMRGATLACGFDIVDKLNSELDAAVADPKMKARFADLGGMSLTGSPAEFAKLIADETEKWGRVIRAAKIKPE